MKKTLYFLLFFTFCQFISYAIPANSFTKNEYTMQMTEIHNSFNFGNDYDPANNSQNYFEDENGKIAYKVIGPANAEHSIVYLTGMGESYFRYVELFYDLENLSGNNIRFYLIDHCGQGFSYRFNGKYKSLTGKYKDIDKTAVYIDKYTRHVDTLKNFMDNIVLKDIQDNCANIKDINLLTHSMGGAVGTAFIEKFNTVPPDKYNRIQYFDRATFSSPMYMILFPNILNKEKYPIFSNIAMELAIYGVVCNRCNNEKSMKFAIGESPRKGIVNMEKTGTSSKNRHYFDEEILLGNSGNNWFDNKNINLGMGGPTYNWVKEAIKICNDVRINPKINIPVQIFQCGNDTVVENFGQDLFFHELQNGNRATKTAKKESKLIKFPDAKHELLRECDELRGDGVVLIEKTALYEIMSFFNIKSKTELSKSL
jgi:alpha-beta hydrolase superfamily lysophospholipase